MKILTIVIIISFSLISCNIFFNKKELYGTYETINFKNTIDTLVLREGNTYYHSIHNVKEKRLIFYNNGRWALKNNRLYLYKTFFTEDNRYEIPIVKFDDVLGTQIFNLKRSKGKIILEMDYDLDQYYKKI